MWPAGFYFGGSYISPFSQKRAAPNDGYDTQILTYDPQHASENDVVAAQSAVVAGTAAHITNHQCTGNLAAQTAAVSGQAAHWHTNVGALIAQVAVVAGTALRTHLHALTGTRRRRPQQFPDLPRIH